MSRPLFMKTYGKKQTRTLNAWISPDNRKRAFASTSSSDLSIGRNTSPKPPVRRVRKSTAAGCGGVRLAKTRALACLRDCDSDSDSDGENVFLHHLPQNQPQGVNTARKPLFRSVGRKRVVRASDSEGSLRQQDIKRPRNSRTKTTTDPSPGEAPGRFVTHRRGVNKHKAPKRRNNVLRPSPNSSDDFTRGVQRAFPRRATREPCRAVASSDSSLADFGNCSTGSGFLREVSLKELSERSQGPCRRKPLFSSTPSSRSLARPPRLLPSISPTGYLLVLSNTQEEMDVSDEPLADPIKDAQSGPGQLSALGPSLGQPELGNCEESLSCDSPSLGSSESLNGGSEIQRVCGGVVDHLSRALISVVACEQTGTDRDGEETEGGIHFVPATVDQDWLAEVKERCLASRCVVQLERVDKLHQETTYTSCINLTHCMDNSRSHNHSGSVECMQSVNDAQPKYHTWLVNDGQSIDPTVQMDQPSVQMISDNDESFVCDTRPVNGCQSKYQTKSVNDGQSIHCDHSIIQMTSVNGENIRLTDRVQSPDSTLSRSQNIRLTDRGQSPDSTLSRSQNSKEAKFRLERLTATQPPIETVHSSSLLSHTRSNNGPSGQTDSSDNHNTQSDSVQGDDRTRSANVAKKKDLPKKVFPKERRRRSTLKGGSGDRLRTSRKACVSGVSVGRWGRRDRASKAAPHPGHAGDCSITELLSAQHTHKVLGDNVMLGTPLRRSKLPLSSLLVNLSPDTHSWSRLKAALSVHRKTKAFLTPKGLPRYLLSSPLMQLRAELTDVSQDLFATPIRTPLPQHLCSQIMRSTPLGGCELDEELSDAEKVYCECRQAGPLGFQDCIPPDRMKNIRKVGEGTFGEVFSTNNSAGEIVALKIIPVEGSEQVNGEEQKTFGEILHEIIISKELSSLKTKTLNQTTGFIGLKDLHCVQGRYPPDLLKAWDCFNTLRGSENDRPDFFSEEQLFLILEFEFGGSDLENSNGQLASVVVAKSILHQVAAALAVAEQELHFEHRDLHWGNVLVQTTKDKQGSFLLNGTSHSLETRGVTVRIIDYSLSRLEIDGLTVSCDISEDEELFQGQGDYQFDIYRIMRRENSNVWSEFHPHSNVLWLHYLCSKLLNMTYRGRGGRGIKQIRVDLQRFHDNVLSCSSASEVLNNCSHLFL